MPKKDYDKIHRTNMDVYARKIQAIYNSAIKEAASIGVTIHDFNPDKLFSFADYPITAARVEKLVKSLQNNIETVILDGTKHEWTLSNNKNNELARRVFGDSISKLSKVQEQRYFSNNLDALAAFQKRKVAGLGLSQRVWKYTEQFKHEIELGIDVGLRDRLPAAEMGRNLREYLQNPDKLFRRVRDEHGVLKLSKAAKAYHPGRGVYRSSVRNTERLARTETNMSYRTSDYERWQQFDFVVGIEIRRSNNRSCYCPMCDSLAVKYRKEFKFVGWHPNCRCYAVPILKTIKELQAETEQIIQGQQTTTKSVNEVKGMPEEYNDWIDKNKHRFNDDNTPYFIRDNYQNGKISDGLRANIDLANDVRVLMSKASESGVAVQSMAGMIATKHNAQITPINYKSEDSILRKINSDQCSVDEIKDAVRTTIIAEKDSIKNILTELQQHESFVRLKQQTADRFMGYSGNIVNIKTKSGIIAEIQVNTDKMIYAKEKPSIAKSIIGEKRWAEIQKEVKVDGGLGHKLYEQWRVLDPESTKAKSIAAKMRDYYSNFQ